jgi:Helix-turn-helix domain
MDERLRFVARLLEGEKMAPLCAEFGISRKTGYKIFDRYRDCGLEALTDGRRQYDIPSQLIGGGFNTARGLDLCDGPFEIIEVTRKATGETSGQQAERLMGDRLAQPVDLLTQVAEWRKGRESQRATNVIPVVRLEEERSRLRAMKIAPADLALRIPVVVGPRRRCCIIRTRTRCHPTRSGSRERCSSIAIASGSSPARSKPCISGCSSRTPSRRCRSTARNRWPRRPANGQNDICSQSIFALGSSALEYLTELTHRRPRVWLHDVDRLHRSWRPSGMTRCAPRLPVGSPSRRSPPSTSATTWRPLWRLRRRSRG